MLVETKMRISKKDEKDKEKEVTEYLPALVNTCRIQAVLPSGMEGILLLMMADKTQHLVKDEMATFKKAKR